uniref:Exosome component 10 n=1 Tax=Gadus morhua TaxID=8049 RepID=A0A8C5A3Q4_GADMO
MKASRRKDPSNGGPQAETPTEHDADEEAEDFCPGYKDVDAFTKYALGSVLSATKASASLPQTGDDFDYYRSFPGFREFCETQGDRLLHCMSNIMQHHGCRSHIRDNNKLTGLEDKFDLLVDSNDVILEKVGILLDEADGVNRSQKPVMPVGYQPPKIVVSSWNRKGADSRGSETFRLLQARNITRPQMKFKEKVDNSNIPFVPKIFIKPNATKPLPSCKYFTNKQIRKERPEDLDVPAALADFIHQQRTQEHVEDMFAHPYQHELDHLTVPERLLSKTEPQMFRPMEETKCSFIDTLEELVALNETLCKVSEFAVDLEHHSYRSFLGLTCLMQISTREQDYIIDSLELRGELYLLNEVFTDPDIVKVFHGADSDIEWLQKDLGLYVVNMFDTHQASRALQHARHSLDHLLQQLCHVKSDKRFQLADWRIRPLPEEMFEYARADTHYLLYIYDRLRGELLDFNHGQPALLQSVWHKSKDISLKKYSKPIFTEESYQDLQKRQKRAFNTQQLSAFRLLFAWRDKLGRQEDESTGYVLPNHMMIKIAEQLPKEPQGIIACCNPVPPLVRQQVIELHLLVQQAREMPLLKVSPGRWDVLNVPLLCSQADGSLFGPHDTSRTAEADGSLAALSVAKQKAGRIIEAFQNPFRMYLPSLDVHVNKAAKLDPSSKVYEISQRWKLQSMEQQQKEQEAKRTAREKTKEKARKAAGKDRRRRSRVRDPRWVRGVCGSPLSPPLPLPGERKKAKLDYQQSLKDVATVRQQVAVSLSLSLSVSLALALLLSASLSLSRSLALSLSFSLPLSPSLALARSPSLSLALLLSASLSISRSRSLSFSLSHSPSLSLSPSLCLSLLLSLSLSLLLSVPILSVSVCLCRSPSLCPYPLSLSLSYLSPVIQSVVD